jgi:hypothetical protein
MLSLTSAKLISLFLGRNEQDIQEPSLGSEANALTPELLLALARLSL